MQTHANMDVLNMLPLQLKWFHKKFLVNYPKVSNIYAANFDNFLIPEELISKVFPFFNTLSVM